MDINESFRQGSFSISNLTPLGAIVPKCYYWAPFLCYSLGHPPSCCCCSLSPQHCCCPDISSLLRSDIHCSLFACRTDLGLSSGKAGTGRSAVHSPYKYHSPPSDISRLLPGLPSNFFHIASSPGLEKTDTLLQPLPMYTSSAALFPAITLIPAASCNLAPKLFSSNQ